MEEEGLQFFRRRINSWKSFEVLLCAVEYFRVKGNLTGAANAPGHVGVESIRAADARVADNLVGRWSQVWGLSGGTKEKHRPGYNSMMISGALLT
jgi:hypothetical protein